MDSNKKKKLQEIEYRIVQSCGTCVDADLSPDGWGVCKIFKYKHKKHTGEERQLSINQYGVCKAYAVDMSKYFPLRKMES